MKSSTIKFAVFVSALIPLNYAVAASFNCANARTVMEKSNVQTPNYQNWMMNSILRTKMLFKNLEPNQLSLSRKRNGYAHTKLATARPQCFIPLYSERIKILKNVASSSEASSKWTGTYARFFNGKEDKDSAGLTLIGLKENKI